MPLQTPPPYSLPYPGPKDEIDVARDVRELAHAVHAVRHVHEDVPQDPGRFEGDMCVVGGILHHWDGTRWRPNGAKAEAAGWGLTGTPPTGAQLLMQAGTTTAVTNSWAAAYIELGHTFPNSLVTVLAVAGGGAEHNLCNVLHDYMGSGWFHVQCYDWALRALPGYRVRVNWIAWGW
jgi:hypothetical protein